MMTNRSFNAMRIAMADYERMGTVLKSIDFKPE
jgi:hypothetical protein